MGVFPSFMPGPCALDLSGRSKQSRSPITPTRMKIAEVAIRSSITQPKKQETMSKLRIPPRGELVDCFRSGLGTVLTDFLNPTNGSWWMVQIRPRHVEGP